jgi:hypothetical protein
MVTDKKLKQLVDYSWSNGRDTEDDPPAEYQQGFLAGMQFAERGEPVPYDKVHLSLGWEFTLGDLKDYYKATGKSLVGVEEKFDEIRGHLYNVPFSVLGEPRITKLQLIGHVLRSITAEEEYE